MGSTNSIRVLCADDHPLIRDGVAFALKQVPDIELVAEAEDGVAAIGAFRAHRPDVILMDLQMPRLNGIDALIAIRELESRAKCRFDYLRAMLKPHVHSRLARWDICSRRCFARIWQKRFEMSMRGINRFRTRSRSISQSTSA